MQTNILFKVLNLNKYAYKLIDCNKCAPKKNNELPKLKKHGLVSCLYCYLGRLFFIMFIPNFL